MPDLHIDLYRMQWQRKKAMHIIKQNKLFTVAAAAQKAFVQSDTENC